MSYRRVKVAKLARFAIAALIILAALDLTALVFLPARLLYGDIILRPGKLREADVIVVFVAGFENGRALNLRSERRVRYACKLFSNGYAPCILFSGGSRPSRMLNGAKMMAGMAEGLGIPRDRLYLETASYDTRGNWVNSRGIIKKEGWSSALLVASAFQIWRLGSLLHENGTRVSYAIVPYEWRPTLSRFKMWWYANYNAAAYLCNCILPKSIYESMISRCRR